MESERVVDSIVISVLMNIGCNESHMKEERKKENKNSYIHICTIWWRCVCFSVCRRNVTEVDIDFFAVFVDEYDLIYSF